MFMEFVDRTLLFHDTSSNIQKFHLTTNKLMSASRVHSWIKYLTMRSVKELNLWLDEHKRFLIPLSLFTCESLTTLEITAPLYMTIHLPTSLSLPKLMSLTLCGFEFTDEQHISNCPVLEILILDYCNWFGVTNFCISTPALKHLEIDPNHMVDDDGLQDCALKINAPNLVSFTYNGWLAKEYFLSSFQALESANIWLCDEYDVPGGNR
ncbi:hypothetical protein C5167_044622 [Papaver somniferum]|uniref:F-box/LRR-repeat protein 15/At3g58940/PEG3-like LRR domain-containing protein n=1 Tax=Papaver somniferum TaxID=3469 RepID=A0A4Y7LC11_PAPSO|nr:hypothetical protein C5167_044622 [Papaver somniferum]